MNRTASDYHGPAVSSHSDATSLTESVPPKLAQVLPRLRTPNITPAWITDSLIPTVKAAYGSTITQTELDDGTWSNVIEKTDLLLQAMDRANNDATFTQIYYDALWMRNRDLDEDVTSMDEISEGANAKFCEILADQGGDFAIAVLMVLRTMQQEVDDNANRETEPCEETDDIAEKSTREWADDTKFNASHQAEDATEYIEKITKKGKKGGRKRKVTH